MTMIKLQLHTTQRGDKQRSKLTQTHNRTQVQGITQRECRETIGQVSNINSSGGTAVGRTGFSKAGGMMRHMYCTVFMYCFMYCNNVL